MHVCNYITLTISESKQLIFSKQHRRLDCVRKEVRFAIHLLVQRLCYCRWDSGGCVSAPSARLTTVQFVSSSVRAKIAQPSLLVVIIMEHLIIYTGYRGGTVPPPYKLKFEMLYASCAYRIVICNMFLILTCFFMRWDSMFRINSHLIAESPKLECHR